MQRSASITYEGDARDLDERLSRFPARAFTSTTLELGFEVVQLGDFNPFAQSQGSVHCTKSFLIGANS